MRKLLTDLDAPADERPVVLSRKELERSQRRAAYKAAKERAKSNPVLIARKQEAKERAKKARAAVREQRKNDPTVLAENAARKVKLRAARKEASDRRKAARSDERKTERVASGEALRGSVRSASTISKTPIPRRTKQK